MEEETINRAQEPKANLLGVVGGVGPEATNKFCEMIIEKKKKSKDQDNIPFIHYCNPKIPDRTEFILGKGENPVPEIVKTCNALEKMGANMLVIPCNTAHVMLNEIQDQVSVPIINMIDLLVRQIKRDNPNIQKIGILATTGSIHSGLFENYLFTQGIESIYSSKEYQEDLVMEAIYGESGIKAGKKSLPRRLLNEAARELINKGAQAIILGCTELPLVMRQSDFDIKLYEPMDVVSEKIVNYIEAIDSINKNRLEAEENVVKIMLTINDKIMEVVC